MTASEVAIGQGVSAQKFQVLDHFNRPADSYNVCDDAVTQGELVHYTAQGVVSQGETGLGAAAKYAGFIDQTVVTTMVGRRVDFHGELALIDVDKVTIWRVGRYRITKVAGVVGDNVLVYPGALGVLTATQTGTDAAVGWARKGNGGVSAGAIEVEINLMGVL